MDSDNRSFADQYRDQGEKYADLESAASLLESMKSVVFSQKVNAILSTDSKMAVNRAELAVKSDEEWGEYIRSEVEARHQANLAKVELEYMRMKFQEHQSQQANERAEFKMTMGGG